MLLSTQIETQIKVQFHLTGNRESQNLFLVLHGFMEKGSKMLRRMQKALPKDALILSPNGPFPLPEKTNTGHKVRYAWYFYDNIKNEYLVDYQHSANLLLQLLIDLQFEKKKLTIIGYSQGGYLAPFLAEKCENIQQIIAIACVMKEEFLQSSISCPLTQIHAKDDKMVSYEKALSHFKSIEESHSKNQFITLESAGHFYNQQYHEALVNTLIT